MPIASWHYDAYTGENRSIAAMKMGGTSIPVAAVTQWLPDFDSATVLQRLQRFRIQEIIQENAG